MIDIRIGQYQFLLEVLALSSKCGIAPEAQKLDASRERRAALAARLKAEPPLFSFRGRPTKCDRRMIKRLKHDE